MVGAISKTLIFILLTTWIEISMAAPYRRLVNFEWEAIPNAQSYEVEIKSLKEDGSGKVYSFKVNSASWNGRLSAGKYLMKLRSLDERNVPGSWSTPSEFSVGLENAVVKYPLPNTDVSSIEKDETKLELQWEPVGGADDYQVEVSAEDGSKTILERTEKNKLTVSLPVAKKYKWKITAHNKEGFQSEEPTLSPFTVLGYPLSSPQILKPENEFVREVKWLSNNPQASFDVNLYRLNKSSKKWEKVQTIEATKDLSLPIDTSLSGGQYQIQIVAKAELHPTSKKSRMQFKVRDGDRSPAAEFTTMLRKSIDRFEGWYGIASYLITKMQFKGTNYEKNSYVGYEALGGTGRVGLGWFKPEKNWGFLGITDLSGFTFNGETKTFASIEVNAVYRQKLFERGEVRFQFGPYFKELPEAIRISEGVHKYDSVSMVGGHTGIEYWHSLNPKIGLQAHLHLFYSSMTLSTPNGQDISPTLSTQFGLLGSYRFTEKLTGLVGYARREDKVAYNINPASGSIAQPGALNESTITGDYLNFFAEWNF